MRQMEEKEKRVYKKQIIRLKKQGRKEREISEIIGLSRSAINRVWTAYCKAGNRITADQQRGRIEGIDRKLSTEQEQEIRQTIIDKSPDQLKLSWFLWTRRAIVEYIRQKHKIHITERSIGNYLKRWGLTCQRPTKRAYAQDDVRVNHFMKEEYPAIASRAKAEGAEIYWGDETGINNQENYQRGYAPKGTPPVLKVTPKKEKINMISAITNQGKVRFMMYDEAMTQQKLIDFMSRIIRDIKNKVFLILDNLRVHHGRKVVKWLEKHKDRIEVFFLPPYSPEYNPDEYLNHALKRDVHSGLHPKNKLDIRHKVHSFMRRLQHRTDCVIAFFRHSKLDFILSGI